MALAFNSRRLTRDVVGVFEPKTIVYDAARRVAELHEELPADWLNDAVKSLLPGPDPDPFAAVPARSQGAGCSIRSGFRRQTFLAKQCGAISADEVLSIAANVLGPQRISPKAQLMIEELFS